MEGLTTLLEQDGYELKGSGPEYTIRCFLPGHDDANPSCSVNDIKGVFYCHRCDKGGTAFHYLVDKRGLSRREAMQYLKRQGWTDASISRSQDRPVQPPGILRDIPPTSFLYKGAKAKGNKIAEYPYVDKAGRLRMTLARYEGQGDDGKRRKTFKAYTPKENGGVWAAFASHKGVPAIDRCDRYPIYRLADVVKSTKDTPERRIWFVEGEKCVESIRGSKNGDTSPPSCTTCLNNKEDITDFSPLAGRRVVLIADRDKAGRERVQKIAPFIYKAGAEEIVVVLPPGDDGYDVADIIEGHDNQFQPALSWVAEQPKHNYPPPAALPAPSRDGQPAEGDRPPEPESIDLGNTPFFRMLGRGTGTILFHLKKTNEIVELRRNALASMNELNGLADLDWWQEQAGSDVTSKSGGLKMQNKLIRASEEIGIVDWRQESIGLGTFRMADGNLVFNAGDRAFVEGTDGRLDKEVSFWDLDNEIFLPGRHIPMKMVSPRESLPVRRAFAEAVMEYRWKNVESAVVFLGWIVAAILGGALPQRPGVWLSGNASTGKTWLLTQTIGKLCGSNCRIFLDPSVPGMLASVKNGALPVCIDEAEPRQDKRGEQRWDDLLQLFRASTSGENIIRPRFGIDSFPVRFTMLFSSIHWPHINVAEWSRFYPLELSSTPIENWPKVRDNITGSLADGKAHILYSSIVAGLPEILRRATDLHDTLLHSMNDAREAHIAAILSAGYEFLSGEAGYIPRRQERDQRLPSGYQAIEQLLGTMIPTHGNQPVPLIECLTSESEEDRERAARYGFKLDEEDNLMLAFVTPLQQLVRQTNLGNIDLRQLVRSLDDVEYDHSKQRNFGPFRRQRFHLFPNDVAKTRFGIG